MRKTIHPGKTLHEDLEALGMSTAELARRIEVPVNRITASSGARATSGSTSRSSTSCGLRSARTPRRSPGCPPWTPPATCAPFPSDCSITVAKPSHNGISPAPAVNSFSSDATGRPIPTISAPAPPTNPTQRAPSCLAVAGHSTGDVGTPSDAVAPRANASRNLQRQAPRRAASRRTTHGSPIHPTGDLTPERRSKSTPQIPANSVTRPPNPRPSCYPNAERTLAPVATICPVAPPQPRANSATFPHLLMRGCFRHD